MIDLPDEYYTRKYELKSEFLPNLKELMGKYSLTIHFNFGRYLFIINQGSSVLRPPTNCDWYVFGTSHFDDEYLRSIGLKSIYLSDTDLDHLLKYVVGATYSTTYGHDYDDLSIFNISRGTEYNWSVVVSTLEQFSKITTRIREFDRLGDLRIITHINGRRIKDVNVDRLSKDHILSKQLLNLLQSTLNPKKRCVIV